MNLSSTLEKSWTRITSSQSKGDLANVSLLAFQLCESIRVEHPELDICFDGKIRVPLASDFKFGLFVCQGDGKANYKFRSLTEYFTTDQLARLHYASIAAPEPGATARKSLFIRPPEIRSVRRGHQYPDLSFKLDDGRRVFVDSLVWEPTYSLTKDVTRDGESRRVVLERKRLKTEELFGTRNKITLLPKMLDTDPPTIENTCMTVWLSSEPMSGDAICSELIVLFFFQYEKNMTLEDMLFKGLHELDWEANAVDTDEETLALWKESWLIRTIH